MKIIVYRYKIVKSERFLNEFEQEIVLYQSINTVF
jgi:hypothetical protein